MVDDPDFPRRCRSIVESIAQLLIERKWLMASAESCTAGWVAKVCTDLAGSSQWFDCGVACYSNHSKCQWLGVRSATINQFGAVSEQVVTEMAQGLLERSRASVAVAISGVAGPGGGTPDTPVGTVHFAWLTSNGTSLLQREVFAGTRDEIRQQSVYLALDGIKKILL